MASTRPRKPNRGEKVLQSLYNSVCQIIDFLPSLEITGDNKTIRVDGFGAGKVISLAKKTTNSPNSSGLKYTGPFALSYDENQNIVIESGYLNRNGQIVEVPKLTISKGSIKVGYITVFSELKEGSTTWSQPKIEIVDKIDQFHYPIGIIKEQENSKFFEQYFTAMAILVSVGQCKAEEKK